MERLIGTWVPIDVENWPLDREHFGCDVQTYADNIDKFFITVEEDGSGEWGFALMSGILRVQPGQQACHFMGEMMVTESDVESLNWKGKISITIEAHKTARISWSWESGPYKGKAGITFWAKSEVIPTLMAQEQKNSATPPVKKDFVVCCAIA